MNQLDNFKARISEVMDVDDIKVNELMKYHTSFKVGGPADLMVLPRNFEDVKTTIKMCKDEEIPYYIIGNGSNLLVKDGGIRGVVIKLTNLNEIKVEDDRIIVDSGASLSDVSKEALKYSLTGFEFACGIPGSVGGALAMNAGAYNGEISNVAESALVIDEKGEIKELVGDELELGYRMSAVLKYGYTVLRVTFKLVKGDYEKIDTRINDLTRRRTEKQPLEFPSAGSTFKRPEGYFAAKLIEDSGLKGTSIGGAQVSPKHSGFIINSGNAAAKDILELIEYVKKVVKEKFGVELNTEVRIIGEDI